MGVNKVCGIGGLEILFFAAVDLGFGILGLGYGVEGSENPKPYSPRRPSTSKFRVSGLGFRGWCSGVGVQGLKAVVA